MKSIKQMFIFTIVIVVCCNCDTNVYKAEHFESSGINAHSKKIDSDVPKSVLVVGVAKYAAVNVRDSPTIVGEVIAQLNKGDEVSIVEILTLSQTIPGNPAKWYCISMQNNIEGYVARSLINIPNSSIYIDKGSVKNIHSIKVSDSNAPVTWGPNSDGYTWNKASYSDKMDICKRMERVSDGNSAKFYYDAFESFYNTTDAFILSTTMDSYSLLVDSASN